MSITTISRSPSRLGSLGSLSLLLRLSSSYASRAVKQQRRSSSPSASKRSSASPRTCRRQPLSQRCALALLAMVGMTYSVYLLDAEYYFALGKQAPDIISQVENLRRSARLFPFAYRFRMASAQTLASASSAYPSRDWKEKAALPEIYTALRVDYSAPDLLAWAAVFNLSLGNADLAQRFYDRFKQVDHNSELVRQVEALHKSGKATKLLR